MNEYTPSDTFFFVFFIHPFTSIISGPSGSGKSTFVKNLLENQDNLLNIKFDYVYIFLGTPESQNSILSSLKSSLQQTEVKIFEINKIYKNTAEFTHKFAKDLRVQLD